MAERQVYVRGLRRGDRVLRAIEGAPLGEPFTVERVASSVMEGFIAVTGGGKTRHMWPTDPVIVEASHA